MPKTKPTVVIGFEVASENVHDVTGYCAAEMAIEQANARGDLPVEVELIPISAARLPGSAIGGLRRHELQCRYFTAEFYNGVSDA